jgi:hypothetical protein
MTVLLMAELRCADAQGYFVQGLEAAVIGFVVLGCLIATVYTIRDRS